MQRQLAAVLIADVVAYSHLMELDEEGTLRRLQGDLRELFEPKLSEHRGRLIKTTGDGLIAEFHSAVDAVRCAVEVQAAKAARDVDVPPDYRLAFRMGINLGDVIVEGADIYGDGVNIAARLEALAEAGGVLISGTVFDQVEKKLAVGFEYLGERRVKNIDRPVRVYRVLTDPTAAGRTVDTARTAAQRRRWAVVAACALLLVVAAGAAAWLRLRAPEFEPRLPLPDRPSIAVLPFTNLSNDPKQEYFADGLADDLITDLARIGGLFVIARNSTFAYKDRSIDVREVAQELGVRYVLQSSIQRAGDRIRINAQLIDAATGGHLWAERYDGSMADIFALQDNVTDAIADALALRLTAAEQRVLHQSETSVPEAYEAFLRGWELYRRTTAEDYARALPFFDEAIRLDPDYGRAYAAAAMVYVRIFEKGWDDRLGLSRGEIRARAEQQLAQAKRAPTSLYHQTVGILLWLEDRIHLDRAIAEFEKAIELDPGDPLSYAFLGETLIGAGRSAEAIPQLQTAMRLDPHYPADFTYFLGLAQFGLGDFAAAAASFEMVTRRNPDDEFPFAGLAAAYGHLGRKPAAAEAIARYNELRVSRGDIPMSIAHMPQLGFRNYADVDRVTQGLRLAGVPESLQVGEFAERNKLTANEMRTLLLGHRLGGRSWTGQEHAATTTIEGVVSPSGDWHWVAGSTARFRDDQLCFERGASVDGCGIVLRNPGGTRAKMNEYIWLDQWGAFTFSQIE